MSVTFYPELTDDATRVLGHHLVCPAQPAQDVRSFARYDQVVAALGDHHEHCRHEDCAPGDPFVVTDYASDAEPQLGVASAHAPLLLRALGFLPEIGADGAQIREEEPLPDVVDEPPELQAQREVAQSGECAAGDMLARIDLALALAPADAGVPAREVGPASRPDAVIDCGRSPGYLQDRLHRLREVADYAARSRRAVCWA